MTDLDEWILQQQYEMDKERGQDTVYMIVADGNLLCFSDQKELVERAFEYEIKSEFSEYKTIQFGFCYGIHSFPAEDEDRIKLMEIIKTHKNE